MTGPIVVERRIEATPQSIFEFLVESSAWAVWQGESCEIDARPGGIFKMVMPDGSTARGQFLELHPHTRVVFTWGWVDNPGVPPGSSVVTIDLEESGDGTLVRLEHRGLVEPLPQVQRLPPRSRRASRSSPYRGLDLLPRASCNRRNRWRSRARHRGMRSTVGSRR